MPEDDRPNPEELLKAVNEEEKKQLKGCLKIFLGMAAGVGKTFAMLEEAQRLHRSGVNIVVGIVDTHGREETAACLEGLRVVPLKTVEYKGSFFQEMNIDAIIDLKPEYALVDELAHSNIPGSRHPKRWQDVVEILDNGINVFTTLNVQHIESLKDVVENIAGVTIQETVPDEIIEAATFIELIDITTGELLQRLKEGKVYLSGQSEVAALHFFQEDRLTALREIVLRYAAEKIDHDLRGMISTVQREQGWKPRERLLVAVSHSPHSQKLIRTTRRLAFNLDARWIALHVNNGTALNEKDSAMLEKNIALARDLGAEVITTNDQNLAEAIARVARNKGVTQIIIGHPPKKTFLDFFPVYTLLDDLARECSEIDIHVIRQSLDRNREKHGFNLNVFPGSWVSYFAVLFSVVVISILSYFTEPFFGYHVVGFLFPLGIISLNFFFRPAPVFLGLFLYAWIWLSFFMVSEKYYNDDWGLFVLYFIVAVLTCVLMGRAKINKEMLVKRELTARALYEIAKEITASPSSQLLKSVQDKLGRVLNGSCNVLIKTIDDGLFWGDEFSKNMDMKERATAIWVFENNKEAGWSTSTLPASQNLYLPLKGFNEVVGVLSFHPFSERELTIEEKNFIYTVGRLVANCIEKGYSQERQQKLDQYNKIEKVYQKILNLLSQQLQKPLIKMKDTLMEFQNISKDGSSNELLATLTETLDGLFHVLENLSAMAKLSSGLVSITKENHSIRDLVDTCCFVLKKVAEKHQLRIEIEKDLPVICFDFSLIELLVCNLILNAVENSPVSSVVEISVVRNVNSIVLSVSDQGKGIPDDMLDSVFERFYRIPGTTSVGFGLGLSIGKTIAEIHGGGLKVHNRPEGGAVFSLFLPIQNI